MNIPSTKAKRMPYAPPELDIYEYAVERGFAESPEAKTMGETFSEINDQSEDGYGHAGENYHGEWY
ncbi:MAG: hypothetical protein IJK07_06305 [Bacteroidales bacterium]|nr:hypothetical protein [Bacteroidales bacterium]